MRSKRVQQKIPDKWSRRFTTKEDGHDDVASAINIV